jgi:hypothetical protein
MFFENRNTRCYFGEKTGGKTKKNRYFTKIEPYLYEFVANESSFGIYTQKLKRLCLKFDNVFNIPYV